MELHLELELFSAFHKSTAMCVIDFAEDGKSTTFVHQKLGNFIGGDSPGLFLLGEASLLSALSINLSSFPS